MNHKRNNEFGFSLVELLIYIAIFMTTSTFLVAILTSITRIQVRQSSVHTVNQEVRFLTEFLERKVQEASVIDMELGISSTILTLRMPKGEDDPTMIYLDNKKLLIREGGGSPRALSDVSVVVDNFEVTKLENPGGRALVEAGIAISYNTENPKAKFSRAIESAITRISAANFDSSLVPSATGLDLGTETQRWGNGYFAGALGIAATPTADLKLNVGGNIGLMGAGNGIFLRSPDGVCHKIIVQNGGGVTTGACY
ncbi:MAG: prepilin-type N-terminal cleavage/methylation domain-containing protein [Patescibacteria group bacterium]